MPSGPRHDRQRARELREAWAEVRRIASPARYVDLGVRIYVVRQDDNGAEVLPGLPKVGALYHRDLGGQWDTVERRWCGESRKPKIWYATERALEIIEHGPDLASGVLIEAGMGAGKTIGHLSKWLVARALDLAEYAGRNGIEIGATSPTDPRLEEYATAVRDSMRPDWYTWHEHRHLLRMVTGVRIRMIGTARRSAAQGSRVQGWNWAAWGGDELQDNCEELVNIMARGRRAPGGRYLRCATATPKISAEWRDVRRRIIASGIWTQRRVDARSNPFVHQSYWDECARQMSQREFDRIVRGIDVGPERAVYPPWSREHNLRPIPHLGAEDVTRQTLSRLGGQSWAILCGHDPGTRYDVTIMLQAYRLAGVSEVCWWVVDELTTSRTTTEAHVAALLGRLQSKWECNRRDRDDRARVHIDPWGQSESSTDRTVHEFFRAYGLDAASAAYKVAPSGRSMSQGRIHVDAGIEMVNRLLCSQSGVRRLFVATNPDGSPVAPRLVDAFEMSERDLMERAEHEKKGTESDRSHWPAALRYALWPLERLPERLPMQAARSRR